MQTKSVPEKHSTPTLECIIETGVTYVDAKQNTMYATHKQLPVYGA